jgi:hypothetical protein
MNKRLYPIYVFVLLLCQSCLTTKTFDPDKKYPPEKLRKDYQLFRGILEQNHPSLYWYATRDSINHYFDQGYAALTDSMTETQFKTLLSFVIARINCGHTSVRYSKRYSDWLDTARRPQFPLIMKWWKDTMVVAMNLNRSDTILKRGMIIQSINGRSARQLTDSLFDYFVTDGFNLTGKYQYLSTGLNFSAWYKNVYGYTPSFDIRYRDTDTVKQVTVPIYDPRADTMRRMFNRRLLAGAGSGRKRGRNIDRFITRNLQIDTAGKTAFMTLNTFENGNGLVRFFHQSFRTLNEQKIPNLVIDVRSNGGGDATKSTLLTRYIIDRKFKLADSLYAITRHSHYDRYIQHGLLYDALMWVITSKRSDGKFHYGYFERHYYKPRQKDHYNGQVYILIGGNSFSATTLFAGALKGQKNVTLVGEETGGGWYGNTAWIIPDATLPNTGIRFRLPRFRLVVDKNREKNGLGVQPDVLALPTAEAIGKGFDFKAAKAKELIDLKSVRKK